MPTVILYSTLACIGFLVASSEGFARNIYVNGVDISSARDQEMENVNIKIDEKGNIFILAPHYQVNEETTYRPLSGWNKPAPLPKHQKPQAIKVQPDAQTPASAEAPKVAETEATQAEAPAPEQPAAEAAPKAEPPEDQAKQ